MLHVAEAAERLLARLASVHPTHDEIVDGLLEMELEFLVDVRADVRAPEAHVTSPSRSVGAGHQARAGASVDASTRCTAPAKLSHSVTFALSARRPGLVRR